MVRDVGNLPQVRPGRGNGRVPKHLQFSRIPVRLIKAPFQVGEVRGNILEFKGEPGADCLVGRRRSRPQARPQAGFPGPQFLALGMQQDAEIRGGGQCAIEGFDLPAMDGSQ
jgi:hypothetical protein